MKELECMHFLIVDIHFQKGGKTGSFQDSKKFFHFKNLEESAALEGLEDKEGCESQHSCATIANLGLLKKEKREGKKERTSENAGNVVE
jgi:hypothetical protein